LKIFFSQVLLCVDKYCSNSSSDFNAEEFFVVVVGVPNISEFPFPNQDLAVFILFLQLEFIVGSTILYPSGILSILTSAATSFNLPGLAFFRAASCSLVI
jgi:hypothetical protein